MRFSFEDKITKIGLKPEDIIVYAQIDTLKINDKLLVSENTCKSAFNNEFRTFGNSLKRIAEKGLIKYTKQNKDDRKAYVIEFVKLEADKALEQISQKVEEEEQKRKIREKKKEQKNALKEQELEEYLPMVEQVITYYNKKIGKKLKVNKYSKRTQMIIDRFKGVGSVEATVKDFEKVIDNMYYWWYERPLETNGDMSFSKYLRPETLFSAKHFDTYLEKNKDNIVSAQDISDNIKAKENEELKQEKETQGVKSNAFGW